MSVVSFIVPGRPMPQPKPRQHGHLRFYPKPYLDWRDEVAVVAQVAALELEERGTPWDATRRAYRVCVHFFQPDKRRTDLDRLVASVFDALTRAGILEDDRFVDVLRASRALDAGNPRVEVEVTGL